MSDKHEIQFEVLGLGGGNRVVKSVGAPVPMAWSEFDERERVREHLLDVLRAEHSKRDERSSGDGSWPPKWLAMEIDAMHAEVNRMRAESGKGPVERDEVERVERSAQGHSDYGAKVALRCAELVRRA